MRDGLTAQQAIDLHCLFRAETIYSLEAHLHDFIIIQIKTTQAGRDNWRELAKAYGLTTPAMLRKLEKKIISEIIMTKIPLFPRVDSESLANQYNIMDPESRAKLKALTGWRRFIPEAWQTLAGCK